jgi:hypothetical protein
MSRKSEVMNLVNAHKRRASFTFGVDNTDTGNSHNRILPEVPSSSLVRKLFDEPISSISTGKEVLSTVLSSINDLNESDLKAVKADQNSRKNSFSLNPVIGRVIINCF